MKLLGGPRIPTQRGFSLIAALIGMGIVMISVWGFLQATSSLKVLDARMDRRIQGEALLASVEKDLEQLNTDDLTELCASFGALNAEAPTRCLPASGISTAPEFDPESNNLRLGFRIDRRKGHPPAGTSCVDLSSCRWRAKGHIFEVKLNGVWITPPSNNPMNRVLIFRKTR